jgi:hypothetical protein
MSLRSRSLRKHRTTGGAERRRRHRHSEGEGRAAVNEAVGAAEPAAAPFETDIEDYLYFEWGAFLAEEAGARAGC